MLENVDERWSGGRTDAGVIGILLINSHMSIRLRSAKNRATSGRCGLTGFALLCDFNVSQLYFVWKVIDKI